MSAEVDQAFIRKMQKKVEEELRNKEKEVVIYWRGEVDRLLKRRHQDMASLLSDLKELTARMDRRLKVL